MEQNGDDVTALRGAAAPRASRAAHDRAGYGLSADRGASRQPDVRRLAAYRRRRHPARGLSATASSTCTAFDCVPLRTELPPAATPPASAGAGRHLRHVRRSERLDSGDRRRRDQSRPADAPADAPGSHRLYGGQRRGRTGACRTRVRRPDPARRAHAGTQRLRRAVAASRPMRRFGTSRC